MKLHLPSSLRKALLACLAALAIPSFTLSSGSAFLGAAAFSLFSSEAALADFNPPDSIDWGTSEELPLDNVPGDTLTLTVTGNKTTVVNRSTKAGEFKLTFDVQNQEANYKLDFNCAADDTSSFSFKSTVNVANLWVTCTEGSAGALLFTETDAQSPASLSGLQNLYVNRAQFWFRNVGGTDLTTNFHIGTGTRHDTGFNNWTLRISQDVATTGSLEVMEDAIVGFQSSNKSLKVSGLKGDGMLTINKWRSSDGIGSVLELNGTGGGSNGNIQGGIFLEDGLKLKINVGNDNGGWQTVQGTVTLNGELELAKGELDIQGSGNADINGELTSGGNGKITLQDGRTLNINQYGDSKGVLGGLDVRRGSVANVLRNLDILDRGLRNSGAATINIGDEDHHVDLVIRNTQCDDNNGKYAGTINIREGSRLIADNGTSRQELTGTNNINGSLIVRSGTLRLGGNDSIVIGDAGSITVYRGATLAVTGISNDKVGRIQVAGEGTEYAALEWCGRGNSATGFQLAADRGLKVKINDGTDSWSYWVNCNILTEVELVTGQFVVQGTTTVSRFTSSDSSGCSVVVETPGEGQSNTLVLGGEGYGESVINDQLQIRENSHLILGSDLTINQKGLNRGNANTTLTSMEGISGGVNLTIGTESEDATFGGRVNISGALKKKGTRAQTFNNSVETQGLVINQGNLIFTSGNAIARIHGTLTGSDGSLRLYQGAQMQLDGGGVYSGALSVIGNSTLRLGADLTVGGLICDGHDGGSTVGTVESDTAVRLTVDGGKGSGTNMHSNTLTIGEKVTLVKTGNGEQRFQGASIHGNVEVNQGTLYFNWTESVIDGELHGSGGIFQVNKGNNQGGGNGRLILNGGGEYGGELKISTGAEMVLGADLQVGNLAADDNTANAINSAEAVNLTVATGTDSSFSGKLALGDNVKLVKDGAGKWTVSLNDLSVTAGLRVQAGTLAVSTGTVVKENLDVELAGGTYAFAVTGGEGSVSEHSYRKLTVSGNGSAIGWADAAGKQTLTYTQLTGTGDLNVTAHDSSDPATYRRLVLKKIVDYSGTIRNGLTGGMSLTEIGHVNQKVNVTGSLVGGAVSKSFKKEGAGSFSIDTLLVRSKKNDGEGLYMNYAGSLTIGEVILEDGAALIYTTGEREQVIRISVTQLTESADKSVLLDLGELMESNPTILKEGICLGITGTEGELPDDLKEHLSFVQTVDPDDVELEWRDDQGGKTLYMTVSSIHTGDGTWDANWGIKKADAPSADLLKEHAISLTDLEALKKAAGSAKHYTEASLVLDGNDDYESDYGQVVLLTDGPTAEGNKAAVIGGALYTAGATGWHEGNTWISLNPDEKSGDVKYHLLVGGSSCVSSEAPTSERAGFEGDTHIQMEGGTVDYIVGGNHVTNREFLFEGNSYISVFSGEVRGGIVGGSTLTAGSASSDTHEFEGQSSIYIYTVLSNGKSTPTIGDYPGAGANMGFTAVVGGNAWIDLPKGATGDVSPTYWGTSLIRIDLRESDDSVGAKKTGTFEKAIVGGNYTAFTSEATGVNLSTDFSGSKGSVGSASVIRITAGEGAVFTGGINGASRRASGGSGATRFTGNTSVTLDGGTYREAVAGGFWFEETASGDHSSQLTGDTTVTVKSGNVWRVLGGSYSLAGGGGAEERQAGNSLVKIEGGRFSSDYAPEGAVGQKSVSFVAGGDFYRDNSGSGHVHEGLSAVHISGGVFDRVHIVGGDYANFTTGGTTAPSTEITGGSEVVLNGSATLNALVVGGSYMTDEGRNGATTITASGRDYATSVSIEGDVDLTAETTADGEKAHSGIAVVGGSVVVDEGASTGGHTAKVTGGTQISIAGGSISGHVVGGSYATQTAGVNTLETSGVIDITLSGGSIAGNVYGGHFSESVEAPDTLVMGDVRILVSGSEVNGNIVGGNYRSATKATSAAPKTGNVEITLQKGSINGDVYAAGWHNAESSKGLKATTASTKVTMHNSIRFAAVDGRVYTVSGGYYKASAEDASVVTGLALLEFAGTKSFGNLGNVSFQDFNEVSNNVDITLAAKRFSVMGGAKSFTKTGKGTLTLGGGLSVTGGAKYSGKIVVLDGALALGAAQDLAGGLAFDMSSRIHGNGEDTAYLRATGAGSLTMKGKSAAKVDLLMSEDAHALVNGLYYLTGALSGIEGKDVKDLFAIDRDTLRLASEDSGKDLILKDNCLVLRVHSLRSDKWYWEGGDSAKEQQWRNTDSDNWTREEGSSLAKEDADVFFDGGALSYNVSIVNTVTPQNVHVVSGSYVFTQEKGTTGGMNLKNGGHLIVGSGDESLPAELDLRLSNAGIPAVELMKGGKLILSERGAISNTSTDIYFNGGVLAYGEVNGKLAVTDNLSDRVHADSQGIVRVQVGNASADTPAVAAEGDDAPAPSLSVFWGGSDKQRATNEGLRLSLEEGIEKSGRGDLTLKWQESESVSLTGDIIALDGRLVLDLVNAKGSVTFGSAGDKGELSVAEGSSVQFISTGAGSGLVLNRSMSGSGLVVIGTEDEKAQETAYRLSGDNSQFRGTLELLGDSKKDIVTVSATDALGGSNTTLKLSGRDIVLTTGTDMTVKAGVVHVTEGTVNYLGGRKLYDGNSGITITGALEGSGVLANAPVGSHHSLTGDLSAFTGTLVASSATIQVADAERSTWTLSAPAPEEGAVVRASLAGNGSFIFAYDKLDENGEAVDGGVVVIEGAIGDESVYGNVTDVENAAKKGKVVIGSNENTSDGTLVLNGNVIQLGDETHSANWRSVALKANEVEPETPGEEAPKAAFVLANGTLENAVTKDGKGGALLKVDTAANGRVDAGGTKGVLFDEIAVHDGGRLTHISGDIVVAEGITKLTLGFDAKSIGLSAGSGEYLITSTGDIDIEDMSMMTLDFTNTGFVEVLKQHREEGARSYLHTLSGGEIYMTDEAVEAMQELFKTGTYAQMLGDFGFKFLGIENGDDISDIVLTGSSKEVYLVLGGDDEYKGDSHTVDRYETLSKYLATVVDADQTLTISVSKKAQPVNPVTPAGEEPAVVFTDADGLHVNNLVGLEGSVLYVYNAGLSEYEAAVARYYDDYEDYEEDLVQYEYDKKRYETELANWEKAPAATRGEAPEEPIKPVEPVFPSLPENITIVLDNSRQTVTDTWGMPEGVTPETVAGIDTFFLGTIVADEHVDFVKTGAGTLSVGSAETGEGGFDIRGDLKLVEGAINVVGKKGEIGTLSFGYEPLVLNDAADDAEPAEMPKRGFTVQGGELIVSGFKEVSAYTADNRVHLEDGAEMIVTGEGSELHATVFDSASKNGTLTLGADDDSAGELTLASAASKVSNVNVKIDGGTLTLTDGASVSNIRVSVLNGTMKLADGARMNTTLLLTEEGGTLDVSNAAGNSVKRLLGNGSLKGAAGGMLKITGEGLESEFSGTFLGDTESGKGAKLVVNAGTSLTLKDVYSGNNVPAELRDGNTLWDLQNDGKLVVNTTAGRPVNLNEFSLSSGSETNLVFNPAYNLGAFNAEVFSWGSEGVKLTVESGSLHTVLGNQLKVGTAQRVEGSLQDVELTLKGISFLHYTARGLGYNASSHVVYIDLKKVGENKFVQPGMHKNALAGATLFWEATDPDSSAWSKFLDNPNSQLFAISDSLTQMLESGRKEELSRTLAAGAGASVSVLGPALMQDLKRQMQNIRNRTTTMGADPDHNYDQQPAYNMWINGESSYHKMNADSLAPGYSLSSWGGTVGVDMGYDRDTTFGIALSALYGNLKSDGPDHASGSMDTTYISLFARRAAGAWSHTLVMSAGMADISLDRTVNYGTGSYTTKGSTKGSALGAMYEVGYSSLMNDRGSFILQTVFNVEVRHAQVDGYTESGCDAALKVGDIKQNTVTFGAGVRTQAVVAENAVNRASILESRMLLKVDAGDRSGSASNVLVNGSAVSANVESAELGAVGIEIGAGLTIPIGEGSGSIFVDGSLELRSGYTNMDANVGYRVSF